MDHEIRDEQRGGQGRERARARLPTFAGRYEAVDVLENARGVTTYRGLDRHRPGTAVVVKATDLHAVPRGTELLLRHEAAVLREIDSPHVAPLLDAGVEDGMLFLAMPFVDGITLAQRLAAGPLGVGDALVLATGLVTALAHVFEHGVLHRDIKPANVMVNGPEPGPLERVTLIDFGFSRSDRLGSNLRDVPLGTARYTSPEQAGLIGREVDDRSDLYSVGVVLFEALAGEPPFTGSTVGDVLRQHVTAAVPSLREQGVPVPRALDELVRRLIAKDPKDRYQTAGAVLADLEQIRDGLDRGEPEPRVVIGAHDRRCCVLAEPAFVGRARELQRLEVRLGRAREDGAALVAVEAASGGGKSRLLEEFARRAAEQGAWVLRGQAVDQAAQRPFQALQGIADALVAEASDDPGLADRLRAAIGDQRSAACAALPALTEVLAPEADVVLGPEAHGAHRSVTALATVLDALGTTERPAVVIVDDLQWADPLTVRLLSRWRGGPEPRPGHHVMVVAGYRPEEVGAGHALRELPLDSCLSLQPLDDGEVRDLVESMAGAVGEDAVATVVGLAAGSPFMASAVLHGLVESGALVCRHPGWEIHADALPRVRSSSRAATLLAQRLELLPRDALVLLSAGAVLGKEFDLDLAAQLVGQQPAEALRARDDARQRHLVWSLGLGTRLSFVHDKVREALLARLRPEARRELHATAARHIEATDQRRVFELAYHFDAADAHDRALPYALAAAEQARAQHALEIAEEQYAIAGRARTADRPTRFAIEAGLGGVTMLLGRYEDSRRHLEQARPLADTPTAQSDIEAKLSELAFKHGDLEASAAASERALLVLGQRIPSNPVAFAVAAVREIVVQALHTLAPRWFVGRRRVDDRAERDLLAARHFSRLGHVYWFTKGRLPTLWVHLRELNLAERYPPGRELAQAYSEHGPAMSIVPWFSRGIDYAERSHRIRVAMNDVWGQAQSLSFTAIVLFAAGRLDDVVERCREAIRLFERTGDRWELNVARVNLAFALYRQGRLGEAVRVARRCYEDGMEIGAVQAPGLGVWSKASGGRVPAHVVATELAREAPDVQVNMGVMEAEAIRLLRAGAVDEALELLTDAVVRGRRAGIRNEYVTSVRAWRATALRRLLEAHEPYSPGRRGAARRARRAARSAMRVSHVYRNHRPHALREAGLVAALDGRRRHARRLLGRSVRVAQEHGMAAEEAESTAALGRVGAQCGWPGSDELWREGERQLAALERDVAAALGSGDGPGSGDDGHSVDAPVEASVTLSLVDRFDTLLDHGRRLASGLSRESVFGAVERAALKLLRAEQCTVLDVSDGTRAAEDAGQTRQQRSLSSSLVSMAIEAGGPVVSHESGEETSESLVLANVRSALCAPIFERGKVTACFYATHSGVAGLFGDDEIRLAEFVATLAGAALENARGFSEVETLQRSLEHRVEERTQQLTTTLHELERLNDQLREANQTKSDFVSMVSHELRTPLTPIVGLSSTLLQRWHDLEDKVRDECLTSIHRQGVRLSRLVDDLLVMSRIEAGSIEAQPLAFDVASVVASVIEGFAEGLAVVDVDCPDELAMLADPDRFQQILVNYLENARKYGEAPFRIEVRADGPWVDLAVCDAGPGVSDEFATRLFEKFTRAPGTAKEAGTGLGLSIVRGLAEAQGGEVWYERNEPQGARFCVRLPRSTAPLRRTKGEPSKGEPSRGEPSRGEPSSSPH